MGLLNKSKLKSTAVDFAKDTVKDEIQGAVEDKVTEVIVDKSIDYALETGAGAFAPWWVMFMWWPIKQIGLLITWPIRILFKKKK